MVPDARALNAGSEGLIVDDKELVSVLVVFVELVAVKVQAEEEVFVELDSVIMLLSVVLVDGKERVAVPVVLVELAVIKVRVEEEVTVELVSVIVLLSLVLVVDKELVSVLVVFVEVVVVKVLVKVEVSVECFFTKSFRRRSSKNSDWSSFKEKITFVPRLTLMKK